MLKLNKVDAGYGGIQILRGVTFAVDKGQIACIVGANGAGKTTTVHCISGTLPLTGGSITFEDQDNACVIQDAGLLANMKSRNNDRHWLGVSNGSIWPLFSIRVNSGLERCSTNCMPAFRGVMRSLPARMT